MTYFKNSAHLIVASTLQYYTLLKINSIVLVVSHWMKKIVSMIHIMYK